MTASCNLPSGEKKASDEEAPVGDQTERDVKS